VSRRRRGGVFLDRDGTIQVAPPPGEFVTRWRDFRFLPGAVDAMARLKRAGLALVLVTNQSCVARGLAGAADVEAVHEAMQALLRRRNAAFDRIYYCPSLNPDDPDRKPNPGMIERGLAELGLDRELSVMVGDSARDLEAGRNAGLATVLLTGETYAGELERARAVGADATFLHLADAVDWIIERTVGRIDHGA